MSDGLASEALSRREIARLSRLAREGWEALAEAREGAREGGAEVHDLEG